MIRTILTFHANPINADKIVELYRREQILAESLHLTRAIESEISVNPSNPGEILVTALWPDADAYREWLDHPNRGRTAPELTELLDNAEIGAGRIYEIDHRVDRNTLLTSATATADLPKN